GRLVYFLHLSPNGDPTTVSAFSRLAVEGRSVAYYGDTITGRRWLASKLLSIGRAAEAGNIVREDLANRPELAFELALARGVTPADMERVVSTWWNRRDTRSLVMVLPWIAMS